MDEEVPSRPAMLFRTFETAEWQIASTAAIEMGSNLAIRACESLMQTESN
jgi:hypothetical protein